MFELTTCVMVDRQGRDCRASRVEWSQIPLCDRHLRTAYLIYAGHLRDMPAPTERDREDAAKMFVQPSAVYVDDREHVVYYIRIGHFVKIGTTCDMYNRMSDLQPDEILAMEIGSADLERDRHRQFAHIRAPKGREYFYPTDELMAHCGEVQARWIPSEKRPPERTAGHQSGVICPTCDLKSVYRRQAHGLAECGSCGYVLPEAESREER